MKVAVKDLNNSKVRDLEVPEAVFDYPYKEHLIHTAVQAYLASQRQGSHHTKTRAEVAGSGRKPWRQKGTGRARIGSIRSPLWRTGGVTFGPRPRSYEMKLSAGERRGALKSALTRKLKDEEILVVDKLELKSHKTGELAETLAKLGVEGKALLVDKYDNENLMLAARNNPQLKTVDALAVNVYDIVDRPHIVVSVEALGRIVEVLSK